MSEKPKGHEQGRNNDTGRFAPIDHARRHLKTNSVEVVPNPGNGDTGRYDKPMK